MGWCQEELQSLLQLGQNVQGGESQQGSEVGVQSGLSEFTGCQEVQAWKSNQNHERHGGDCCEVENLLCLLACHPHSASDPLCYLPSPALTTTRKLRQVCEVSDSVGLSEPGSHEKGRHIHHDKAAIVTSSVCDTCPLAKGSSSAVAGADRMLQQDTVGRSPGLLMCS